MAFQFMCPQGHLLEGEESLAGTQLNCPQCQMLFIVPDPVPAAATAESGLPDVTRRTGSAFSPTPHQAAAPDLLHIPCPKGHILETPPEMLGQLVLCPHCGAQFTLKQTESLEHKAKKEKEQELADRKSGNLWFNWAVAIAVVVLAALIFLIVNGV